MLYRKIDNHRCTAAYNAHRGAIIAMYADGFEDIVDFRHPCNSEKEAIEYFRQNGWETYDPNAELKAQGFVFRDGCYRKG